MMQISPRAARALPASVVFVLACGSVEESPSGTDAGAATDDAARDDADAGELTGDAAPPDADLACEPGTSLCTDDAEMRCNDAGEWEETRGCALGCDQAGAQCLDIEPSNGLAVYLDDAEDGPAIELGDQALVDTSGGAIVIDGEPVAVASDLIAAPAGGVDVRVFSVASLAVTGAPTIEGDPALAFVADGDIIIEGLLQVAGRGDVGGPGHGPDGDGKNGSQALCGRVTRITGGGGGGGFGGPGGKGGDAEDQSGGAGGAIAGTEQLVPLRGGGAGEGTGVFGSGGGAVQLVSRSRILVREGGAIDAGGAAGGGNSSRAGGGGAGGGVLLEASQIVVIGAGSAIAANGGGGGCRDVGESTLAEDGRLDSDRARGCQVSGQGNGGRGGAGSTLNGNVGLSGPDGSCPSIGGGGGGAAGRIRVNTLGGAFTVSSDAVVSPPASEGELATR